MFHWQQPTLKRTESKLTLDISSEEEVMRSVTMICFAIFIGNQDIIGGM